jgi:hypothetical protein
MIDSGTKNLGKVEYDNQISKIRRKIRKVGFLLVSPYLNQSITKKFQIKTLLKIIDSGVRNLGQVEYDKKNCL